MIQKIFPVKKLLPFVVVLIPILVNAQVPEYIISSCLEEAFKAPSTHYNGDARLCYLVKASNDFG